MIAWIVGGLFVSGWFIDAVGAWSGPVLGAWFAGTQKPQRGFVWLLAFALFPGLISDWRKFPLTGPEAATYLGWMLLAAVISVLPFTFHRLTGPRLPGLFSTLPLPVAAAAIHSLASPLLHSGTNSGLGVATFLRFWFAATVVWMWNLEFRGAKVGRATAAFSAAFLVGEGLLVSARFNAALMSALNQWDRSFGWACLCAAFLFSAWAIAVGDRTESWAARGEALALLRSPDTGEPLHLIVEGRTLALGSKSGERFPVRNGIPEFLKATDLTGDNGKYNHLYETIGGFYDDTQRFFSAFRGLDLDSYFRNYMDLLDVKPGDSVLETSVGTGLNFKYLPAGARLTGLDLSAEMLGRCQANLRRWDMKADIYLGNAERLPFADASFDVVYTAGAFNFFSNRVKAVQEMIRVARPGAALLIEDETEDYVKSTYEKIPYTSSFYSGREKPVSVPIDLVPQEMEDIHLEMLKDGKFFAITFRKPLHGAAARIDA
jgi:ubiquinone/menaquinone biosynthesis C-methylase UbiE